jgi:hypothetical protein
MHKTEQLTPEQFSKLDNLPGWTWNKQASLWESSFAALEKFATREGHAKVPAAHREDGFRLGGWVQNQRRRKERLSLSRISRLESVSGWVWAVTGDDWENGFAALEEYTLREGHALVPQFHKEKSFNLGYWVSNQRAGKDRLSLEQMSRLDTLPGWSWNSLDSRWEAGFSALTKFVQREGHPNVPKNHFEGNQNLWSWVSRQRSPIGIRRLTTDRKARLSSLPGWEWPN